MCVHQLRSADWLTEVTQHSSARRTVSTGLLLPCRVGSGSGSPAGQVRGTLADQIRLHSAATRPAH